MQLTAESIRARLRPLPPDVPKDYLRRVRDRKIPYALERALIHDKLIIVDPFPSEEQLARRFGPVTLDFPLGNEIEIPRIPLQVSIIDGKRVIRRYTYDERRENMYCSMENEMGTWPVPRERSPTRMRLTLTDDDTYELTSNTILIGYTKEIICLPVDLVGHVNGKSRHARRGFKNHMTAPRFDPGFIGFAALEMSTEDSSENINIYPGMIIAAFEFIELDKPAATPYFKKIAPQFLGQS